MFAGKTVRWRDSKTFLIEKYRKSQNASHKDIAQIRTMAILENLREMGQVGKR